MYFTWYEKNAAAVTGNFVQKMRDINTIKYTQ